MEHASNVDVDHAVPLVDLQLLKFGQRHHAGVVHHDINASVSFQREVRESPNVIEPGDVERAEMRHASRIANLVHEFLETIGAAGAEDDTRALAGQHPSGGVSDAAAGASNKNDFVLYA